VGRPAHAGQFPPDLGPVVRFFRPVLSLSSASYRPLAVVGTGRRARPPRPGRLAGEPTAPLPRGKGKPAPRRRALGRPLLRGPRGAPRRGPRAGRAFLRPGPAGPHSERQTESVCVPAEDQGRPAVRRVIDKLLAGRFGSDAYFKPRTNPGTAARRPRWRPRFPGRHPRWTRRCRPRVPARLICRLSPEYQTTRRCQPETLPGTISDRARRQFHSGRTYLSRSF